MTGVSSSLNLPGGGFTGTEVAANRNDGVIYYALGGVNRAINAYDPILGINFNLVTGTDVLGVTGVTGSTGPPNLVSLGYDQMRNFLYAGFSSATDVIAKISPRPYNRYVTPGVQTYTATLLQLPTANQKSEITVEPETGYLYVTTLNVLSKVNPNDMSIMASVSLGTGSSHSSFASDNELYVFTNTPGTLRIRRVVNRVTLDLVDVVTTVFPIAVVVNDLTEPLFNM